MSENKNEQKIYSPVFNDWHQILFSMPAVLLFFFQSFGLLAILFFLFGQLTIYVYGLFWGGIFIIRKLLYKNTQFSIEEDGVLMKRNWKSLFQRKIFYKDITEVTLKEGFLQNFFGLGTVRIVTASGNFLNSGIRIYNIRESQEVFNTIHQTLQKIKSSSSGIPTKQS